MRIVVPVTLPGPCSISLAVRFQTEVPEMVAGPVVTFLTSTTEGELLSFRTVLFDSVTLLFA